MNLNKLKNKECCKMEESILKLLQGDSAVAGEKKRYKNYAEFSKKSFPLSKVAINGSKPQRRRFQTSE
jgi:hypothetical protein